VFVEGHEHDWNLQAATDSRSRGPFWQEAEFHVKRDRDTNGTQSHFEAVSSADDPIDPRGPVRSLADRGRFTLRLTLDAEVTDDRGGESAAQAVVDNFGIFGSRDVTAATAARAPKPKAPKVRPQGLAHCPGGPAGHAGTLQLSSRAFTVDE